MKDNDETKNQDNEKCRKKSERQVELNGYNDHYSPCSDISRSRSITNIFKRVKKRVNKKIDKLSDCKWYDSCQLRTRTIDYLTRSIFRQINITDIRRRQRQNTNKLYRKRDNNVYGLTDNHRK